MKPSGILKSMALCAAIAAGLASNSACATPFGLDHLLGAEDLSNSGAQTELDALKALVPYAGTLVKTNQGDLSFNVQQNPGTTDEWVIDVGTATPGYFVLKFGTGSTGGNNDTYFFENLFELRYLVFSNQQVSYLSGGACGSTNSDACNIGKLSHYSISADTGGDPGGGGGGNGGEIPEPATPALLGLGMAGLLARRRSGS